MIKLKDFLLEQKRTTLKSINNIAKKYGLELVKGKGYFYWYGLNDKVGLKLAGLHSTSVYVYKISDLSFDSWMAELDDILKQLGMKKLTENGSYFEKKKIPKEGDIVYCLISKINKVIKGKILRIMNIDNKGFGNVYADVQAKNKIWHVAINQIYDHKPKKVEIDDEYGKVKVWK